MRRAGHKCCPLLHCLLSRPRCHSCQSSISPRLLAVVPFPLECSSCRRRLRLRLPNELRPPLPSLRKLRRKIHVEARCERGFGVGAAPRAAAVESQRWHRLRRLHHHFHYALQLLTTHHRIPPIHSPSLQSLLAGKRDYPTWIFQTWMKWKQTMRS